LPIPIIASLNHPTIKEIVDELDAKVLLAILNNEIGNYSVGAMQLRNYLVHKRNALVITGDRADIILGALQANESTNYPSVSGNRYLQEVIPEDSILKLIEGLTSIVPIISVDGGTYRITIILLETLSRRFMLITKLK
jgi:phosphate acetyltransferase